MGLLLLLQPLLFFLLLPLLLLLLLLLLLHATRPNSCSTLTEELVFEAADN